MGPPAPSARQPVLDAETLHAAKLFLVVGDERGVEGPRLRGDPEVVLPDRRRARFSDRRISP